MLFLYCALILCSVSLSSADSAWCREWMSYTYYCSILPSDDTCGKRPLSGMKGPEPGDNKAALGQFPWTVCLQSHDAHRNNRCSCGGAWIGNRYILTAARCAWGGEETPFGQVYWAKFGEHDLTRKPDCEGTVCAPPAQDMIIKKFLKHPRYSESPPRNDLGLIQLYSVPRMNNYVVPICLPYANRFTRTADNYVMVGWHIDNYLKAVGGTQQSIVLQTSSMTEVSDCQKGWKDNDTIDFSHFCTKPMRDSLGSPLYGFNNSAPDQYFLIGLNSYVAATGIGNMSIFTRVQPFINWILVTVEDQPYGNYTA